MSSTLRKQQSAYCNFNLQLFDCSQKDVKHWVGPQDILYSKVSYTARLHTLVAYAAMPWRWLHHGGAAPAWPAGASGRLYLAAAPPRALWQGDTHACLSLPNTKQSVALMQGTSLLLTDQESAAYQMILQDKLNTALQLHGITVGTSVSDRVQTLYASPQGCPQWLMVSSP